MVLASISPNKIRFSFETFLKFVCKFFVIKPQRIPQRNNYLTRQIPLNDLCTLKKLVDVAQFPPLIGVFVHKHSFKIFHSSLKWRNHLKYFSLQLFSIKSCSTNLLIHNKFSNFLDYSPSTKCIKSNRHLPLGGLFTSLLTYDSISEWARILFSPLPNE